MKGVMKNIFKFMGVAILGIFGYYLIQPYAPLVVGMISLFFAWQLFQSTLPEMEDWRLRIMQAEIDSLKRWADRISVIGVKGSMSDSKSEGTGSNPV